jgi:hypothetical protein
LTDPTQSPDGIGNYGLRSVPTIIAGKNSANAVSLDNPLGITPGSTYNWFFNQNYPTNYVNDWNVTFEKEFKANTLVRFGYVGNHSGNQGMTYAFNDQTPSYIWYATQGTALPTGPLANVTLRQHHLRHAGRVQKERLVQLQRVSISIRAALQQRPRLPD